MKMIEEEENDDNVKIGYQRKQEEGEKRGWNGIESTKKNERGEENLRKQRKVLEN